ncbi:hypothetical protein HZB02_07030 [Candidatus Woesearchaeota archaeon]|nr:hypothetical protein [Candidatus Woesearchaeota archaeon]
MSELEHAYHAFLLQHPEIKASLAQGLVNTRALARLFIKAKGYSLRQTEAVVAMIRRSPPQKLQPGINLKVFAVMKVSTKDEIAILDYSKSRETVERIRNLGGLIEYDKNETLKVIIGAHTLKIIVDHTAAKKIKDALGKHDLRKQYEHISEISLLFPESAHEQRGIVAYVTSQLLMHGINLQEVLTCTPELLLYVDESQSLKTFEVCKRIKNGY